MTAPHFPSDHPQARATVACPECGVAAGERCVNPVSGDTVYYVHDERYDPYRAMLALRADRPWYFEAEALDKMPDGTVVLDEDGDVSQKRDGRWLSHGLLPMASEALTKHMPVQVLHLGKAA